MALQASLTDTIGQVRVGLGCQLDRARADSQQAGRGAFGEPLTEEMAILKARAMVEELRWSVFALGGCSFPGGSGGWAMLCAADSESG
jgi:hypothetical protein